MLESSRGRLGSSTELPAMGPWAYREVIRVGADVGHAQGVNGKVTIPFELDRVHMRCPVVVGSVVRQASLQIGK
jgi:hypothetical protein